MSRVARLEAITAGRQRLIVVVGPQGVDVDAQLASRGLAAESRDLVVVVGKFSGVETTVTLDGSMVE